MSDPPVRFPASATRWVPGFRLGRYELLSSIAEGGMAAVWVARLQGEHGFEKLVAIKTILAQFSADPRYEAMFLDEARIIANIRHPNVAQILDLGSDDSLPYLVLEWIEGDSLSLLQRAVTQNKQPIPVPVTLHVLARMCAGLHAAHELRDRSGKRRNVVHRDISPQNVLLSSTGEVKLIDFGIAKALDQTSQETHTGVLKGKISFMSPEQANGERLDARADIWSAGVVLYQLLCGELPFRGESQLKTLHQIRSRVRPPPISGLPSVLQKLLDRMLEPNREQRIASAAELESEVERVSNLVGQANTRDVAALVQEHLGPRIAARRATIEAALGAASQRTRTLHDADTLVDRDPAEVTATARTSRRPSSHELVTPSGAVLMRSYADTVVDAPPRRRRPRALSFLFLGLSLVGGVGVLLSLGGKSRAPAVASASAPSARSAPSAAPLTTATTVEAPPLSAPQTTATASSTVQEPPVARVEDVPTTSPTHKPALSRPKPAPRVVAPKPERDVWSAFSEHR